MKLVKFRWYDSDSDHYIKTLAITRDRVNGRILPLRHGSECLVQQILKGVKRGWVREKYLRAILKRTGNLTWKLLHKSDIPVIIDDFIIEVFLQFLEKYGNKLGIKNLELGIEYVKNTPKLGTNICIRAYNFKPPSHVKTISKDIFFRMNYDHHFKIGASRKRLVRVNDVYLIVRERSIKVDFIDNVRVPLFYTIHRVIV